MQRKPREHVEGKIGEVLRRFRTGCNLTQQQVADALGIDRTTYTCYECNRTEPNIEMLRKLTDIFNISYNQLLPLNDPKKAGVADSRGKKDKEKIYELSTFEQQLLIKIRTLSPEQRFDVVNFVDEIL